MEFKYIMDTNVFITAHRQMYPFDVAPGFWKQLVDKAADKIIIIEEVQNEILKGRDPLADWYRHQSSNFTVLETPGPKVIEAYRKVINSVNGNGKYTQLAKDEFAAVADSWLCAYALGCNLPIVTLEKYKAGVKNRVIIPNVCEEFGIRLY